MKPTSLIPAFLACLALTAGLAACRGDRPDAPGAGTASRDSAGIAIRTAAAPAYDSAAWRVAAKPEISIGTEDGPAHVQLFNVWSALRRDDGSIVVGNAGTFDVRFYGRNGRHVRTVGRHGQGPGEYGDVSQIFAMPGDSIGVFDNALRRITVYDRDGNFARVRPMPLAKMFTRVLDVAANGAAVIDAIDAGFIREIEARTSNSAPVLRHVFAIRLQPDGRADTLGRFFNQEEGAFTNGYNFFGPYGGVLTCGETLISWRTDRYELLVHDSAGSLERIVRREYEPVRVTDAFFDEFKRDYLRRLLSSSEGGGSMPKALADRNIKRMAVAQHADFLPAMNGVVCDVAGNIWVDEYPPMQMAGETRWSVFSPEGVWLTQVMVPNGVQILQIGRDYVLGKAKDDDGVEQVRVYALRRRS